MKNYHYFIVRDSLGNLAIRTRKGCLRDRISEDSQLMNIDCLPCSVYGLGDVKAKTFSQAVDKTKIILEKNKNKMVIAK